MRTEKIFFLVHSTPSSFLVISRILWKACHSAHLLLLSMHTIKWTECVWNILLFFRVGSYILAYKFISNLFFLIQNLCSVNFSAFLPKRFSLGKLWPFPCSCWPCRVGIMYALISTGVRKGDKHGFRKDKKGNDKKCDFMQSVAWGFPAFIHPINLLKIIPC